MAGQAPLHARSAGPPRAVVVGVGAVGTLLGGCLSAAGWRVTLMGRRADIELSGPRDDHVRIMEPDGTEWAAPVRSAATAELLAGDPEPDLVAVAVKQPALEAALSAADRWPEATLLTLQNGIGAEELAAERRPAARVIAGSLTASVEPAGHLAVRRLRRGGLGLAAVGRPAPAVLGRLVRDLDRAGLPTRRHLDAAAMKWSKLLGNLVGSATSALLDRDPAWIYRRPGLFRLERRQLLEALAVMRAGGHKPVALPGADARLLAIAVRLPESIGRPILAAVVGGARGGKAPSLRLHLRSGPAGPSEAPWMQGAVAAAGARAGIPTPVNRALADLVEEAARDVALRDRFVGRPEALLAEVDRRDG